MEAWDGGRAWAVGVDEAGLGVGVNAGGRVLTGSREGGRQGSSLLSPPAWGLIQGVKTVGFDGSLTPAVQLWKVFGVGG